MKINEIGIHGGYGVLLLTLKDHPEFHLEADHIRPRSTDDPIVVEVLKSIHGASPAAAFPLGGMFLKGHFVERAYIYPILLDGKPWPGGRDDG